MWFTPSAPPANIVKWCIEFPSHGEWSQLVVGAISLLLQYSNFEESGGLDLDDTIEYTNDIFSSLKRCFPLEIGDIFLSYRNITSGDALLCDGTAYNKADYPELATLLNGITPSTALTFDVPDMIGRSPVGTGTAPLLTTRNLNDNGGKETHTLSESEIPSHTHTRPAMTSFLGQPIGGTLPYWLNSGIAGVTGYTGGGNAHNNMHPFRAVHHYIVAR